MNYLAPASGNASVCKWGVELVLNKNYQGVSVLPNAQCVFGYNLDFSKEDGIASLHAINDVPVDIALYPHGQEGMWDFISAMPPTWFVVKGLPVLIYRVALNIDPFTGEESAAILFQQHGASILSTGNFDTYCTALAI